MSNNFLSLSFTVSKVGDVRDIMFDLFVKRPHINNNPKYISRFGCFDDNYEYVVRFSKGSIKAESGLTCIEKNLDEITNCKLLFEIMTRLQAVVVSLMKENSISACKVSINLIGDIICNLEDYEFDDYLNEADFF